MTNKELPFEELKDFLEEQYLKFNQPDFIKNDPISIPHLFSKKEDIEICGFITAILSWGQRATIIRNCEDLMQRMDHAPLDFIINHTSKERKQFGNFIHRTFNGIDCIYFLKALQHLYTTNIELEGLFKKGYDTGGDLSIGISYFKNEFLKYGSPDRTQKHLADPLKNSTAKRILMYLRWMIRNDAKGVDFGIWKSIPPSALYAPIDLHSARVARKLGLLQRTQNDWKAVNELTIALRLFDANDPIKYDFALFGLGVNGEF